MADCGFISGDRLDIDELAIEGDDVHAEREYQSR
jgi:hypothetical protein